MATCPTTRWWPQREEIRLLAVRYFSGYWHPSTKCVSYNQFKAFTLLPLPPPSWLVFLVSRLPIKVSGCLCFPSTTAGSGNRINFDFATRRNDFKWRLFRISKQFGNFKYSSRDWVTIFERILECGKEHQGLAKLLSTSKF